MAHDHVHTPHALASELSATRSNVADVAGADSSSSPRRVRFPPMTHRSGHNSSSSSAIQSLTSASTLSTIESTLDLSPPEVTVGKGLLRDSFLDDEPWKDQGSNDDPEEMQKNDPLGTQMWKLYHKTKGQLPNSERLENLTWRMMSMKLRRRELEEQG